MQLLFSYLGALAALAVLDVVWLNFIKDFYMSQVGHLFAAKMNWVAAVLFYLLYAGAVVYFAANGANSLQEAALRGALLGFTAYMTYDLVNLATLSGWTIPFAVVDVAWGTVITAAAAVAAFVLL